MVIPKIISLITAAGHSSRMGFPKALLPIDNNFAVVSIAKVLFSHNLKTCITLPKFLLNNSALRGELALYDAHLTQNRYEELGFSGSIKTILEEVLEADGIFVIPVDTWLCSSLLRPLITLANFYRNSPCILVPYARGLAGHPVYFSQHFFADLMRGHCLGGPRAIIIGNKKYVHRILWSDARILINLNHLQDFVTMAYSQIPL